MNPEDQVIADIDAFIDEQLAAGEPDNGYDYDDPDYPECPHPGCCVTATHRVSVRTTTTEETP